MTRRGVALGLYVVSMGLFVAGAAGFIITLGVNRGTGETEWVGIMFALVNAALATSGYVIARQTGNPIGWLLLGDSLVTNLAGVADSYALYALLKNPGSLPAGEAAAWIADFVISGAGLLFGVFVFLILLFPDGVLPSGRWRVVPWLAGLGALVSQLGVAFGPGPLPGFPTVQNPLGSPSLESVLNPSELVAMLLILSGLIGAVASMISRFRRSDVEQRQQMKWFAAAAGFLALVILSGPAWWFLVPSFGNIAWPVLFATGLIGIPISIAVSVLKYRLYEIDVVISKTLVYVSLTAILASCYFGLIVLLQRVLPIAGDSDLAVAASTLVVAGLFQPLRARVQAFIDRRFYRRKYDAAETLGEFSGRLRDEVDLDSLQRELVDVVATTMQPTHASVWLRPGTTA